MRLEDAAAIVAKDLMAIEGVVGVGIGADRLHVYLKSESATAREAINDTMRSRVPKVTYQVVVSGAFMAGPATPETDIEEQERGPR